MPDIVDAIDKAVADYTVNRDAMRWSPEMPAATDRFSVVYNGVDITDLIAPLAPNVRGRWTFLPLDPERSIEALRPAIETLGAFFAFLSEQMRAEVAR